MLKFGLLIVIYSLVSVTAAARPESPQSSNKNICKNREALRVLERRENYRPLSSLKDVVRDREIVLIGELHATQIGFRSQLMTALAGVLPGPVCYFYELDRETPIKTHLKRFAQPGYDEVLVQFGEIHRAAKRLGWKEMAVDIETSPEDISNDEINRRDQAMAELIEEQLRAKPANALASSCKSAVMFVGKAHLVNESSDRRNLGQNLKERGVRALTINLQDPNDDRMGKIFGVDDASSLQSWRGVCPKSAKTRLPNPAQPLIFFNQALPKGMRVFTGNPSDQAIWDSFDLTILSRDHRLGR